MTNIIVIYPKKNFPMLSKRLKCVSKNGSLCTISNMVIYPLFVQKWNTMRNTIHVSILLSILVKHT